MELKARVMDPRKKDDITEILATITKRDPGQVAYLVNYYPPGLKETTVGPHSRVLVGVSRFYPQLDPPVIVDFEPPHPDKWWYEEKLRYCTTRRLVYIPIALKDRLTEAQFGDRYRDAKIIVDRQTAEDFEDTPYSELAHLVEGKLAEPEFVLALDNRALALAVEEIEASGKRVFGVARRNVVAKHRRALVLHFRKQLKHGVDPAQCYRELTSPIERWGDGQVHPPESAGPGA